MVSKASEDFPEPLTPVTTVNWFMGIENEMFLRLLTRAPRTSIASWVITYLFAGLHSEQSDLLCKPYILRETPSLGERPIAALFVATAVRCCSSENIVTRQSCYYC